jgi:CBS domain containing-hemolysin-like protein
MVSALAGFGAVLALTIATGYFVAQEFAFLAADRSRLAAEAERGDVRAQRALSVMSRLSFMLSGAQLGITVTALVVGFIAEPATSALIEPVLSAAGTPTAAADGIALATGFVLATVVQMVLGELLPKNLALARAEPLARFLAPSTLVYLRIAGPVIRLFDSAATRLVRAVGVEPIEELHHGATLAELGDIIGESRRSGRLPTDLSALLNRALTFGERTAAEVMVPRPDVVAVASTTTVRRLTGLIAAAGHTNYPVYLITESRRLGLIDRTEHDLLDRAITVYDTKLTHLIIPADQVTTVPADATSDQVRRVSAAHGHTRLLVRADEDAVQGMLHVREAVTDPSGTRRAADMIHPVPTLAPDSAVLTAVTTMQRARAQLAVVATADDPFIGLVSLDDLLGELLAANPH